MKNIAFLVLLFVMAAGVYVNSQSLTQGVQPGNYHPLAGREFTGSDSSYIPQYVHNDNNILFCRGIMVTDACDSALIMVHGYYNSSAVRFPFKIGRNECGYMMPTCINKIWQSGTQVWVNGEVVSNPLDYIWVAPDNKERP